MSAAAVAGGVLVGSAASSRALTVSAVEQAVFRFVNEAPDALWPMAWPIMQTGSLGAVGVAAAIEWRSEGVDPARLVGATGLAVWVGAKAVKQGVGRGRPDQHLDDVRVRGPRQRGLGYPSGHAAVSTALAMTMTATPAARVVGLAVAGITGAARIYAGAHLPLDVAGGHALGLLAALAARR